MLSATLPLLQGKAGTRLELGGNSLACYRCVAVEDLLADHRQGIFFEVSFDEPDFLRRKTSRDKVSDSWQGYRSVH